MTFNQWASGKDLDISLRFAFEALWRELSGRGCMQAQALLTDLFEAIPRPDFSDEEDLF